MDHVAIMSRQFGDLISKILNKEKVIESRWSKNKIAPYDKIKAGDTVYFKNSGGPIIARAKAFKILQFDNLNQKKFEYVVKNFGKQICLQNTKYDDWYKSKNYVTLIFLTNPEAIKPFNIDKLEGGNKEHKHEKPDLVKSHLPGGTVTACAWITISNINSIVR